MAGCRASPWTVDVDRVVGESVPQQDYRRLRPVSLGNQRIAIALLHTSRAVACSGNSLPAPRRIARRRALAAAGATLGCHGYRPGRPTGARRAGGADRDERL